MSSRWLLTSRSCVASKFLAISVGRRLLLFDYLRDDSRLTGVDGLADLTHGEGEKFRRRSA